MPNGRALFFMYVYTMKDNVENVLNEIERIVKHKIKDEFTWKFLYKGSEFKLTYHQDGFEINNCINVRLEKNPKIHLYIESYYYGYECNDKISIPHVILFDFLDVLGRKLKVNEINLMDVSSKDLKWCGKLPVEIFALAGDKTFYGRYGYTNKSFDDHIKRVSEMTVHDLVRSGWFSHIYNYFLDKTSKEMIKNARVKDIARYIVDTCKAAFGHKDVLPEHMKPDVQKAKQLLKFLKKLNIYNYQDLSVKYLQGGKKRRTCRTKK